MPIFVSQHLQACSFDCHTELPSEQRSRKRRRLNFMLIAFGRRSSFFCSVGSLKLKPGSLVYFNNSYMNILIVSSIVLDLEIACINIICRLS